MMTTYFVLCFNFRAEKEKMNEKSKDEENQEEVDDSGFFAGKISLIFQSVSLKKS